MLLRILKQCCYCQPQRLKKKGGNKAKPFHAQHHPVKQAMHLKMASGMVMLRSGFLLRALLLHFYSMYFLHSNPGNGRIDKFMCPSCYWAVSGASWR